jgi:hypothetical protein
LAVIVGAPGDGRGVVAEIEGGIPEPGSGFRRAAQRPQNRDESGFSDWQRGHFMRNPLIDQREPGQARPAALG